jgi:hypothetical protein
LMLIKYKPCFLVIKSQRRLEGQRHVPADRIVLLDFVLMSFRKQGCLAAIGPFDKFDLERSFCLTPICAAG